MGRVTPAVTPQPAPTRRQRKITLLKERIARDSGPEAEVARNLLAKVYASPVVAEVDPNAPDAVQLEQLADAAVAAWGKGIDASFETGHYLLRARKLFPGDREYGRWFRSREWPFGRGTEWNLRKAASNEPEVRGYLAANKSVWGQRDLAVTTAVVRLFAKPKPGIPTAEEKAAALAAAEAKDAEGTPAFVAFRKAASALDVTQLPADELAELAGIIKELAAAYNAERTRR